ncbi:polysaccharide deacetylase [Planococcus antarcticus DSM 14505]|uniref:Polysaccharide deacetylase n=1 Tax=Planococcus antarcticus DSM 14505 TaxID=1185653 RepID=A0A1C7DG34_9BACL|nr:polysaccharide deacetylase family protein [Planococcus antarcticus]ANU10425.1 polysaccharide deacetylase [Planococcus antarcticus DSM 14505]EIM08589.1 polysaccharide deacetylase [Planococcus antarcticus DSM 14505]
MVHKKWIAIVAATFLLTACGEKTKTSSSEAEEIENIEKNAETKKQEVKEEEVTKEAMEEEGVVEAQYRINTANWSVQPIADAAEKVVLVTIDDAPDQHSMEMAETLKSLEIPAIFFVNGHFLDTDEKKEQVKKIHEMGFVIGNHTESHQNLKDLTEQQQEEEILRVNKAVEEIIGEKPKFFRAPFGSNTDFSKQLVKDQEMVLMNWTYGYDWEKQYQDAQALTGIMIDTEYLNNGANLLMHDRDWTAEALPDIIQGLEDKGYGFVDPKTIEGI